MESRRDLVWFPLASASAPRRRTAIANMTAVTKLHARLRRAGVHYPASSFGLFHRHCWQNALAIGFFYGAVNPPPPIPAALFFDGGRVALPVAAPRPLSSTAQVADLAGRFFFFNDARAPGDAKSGDAGTAIELVFLRPPPEPRARRAWAAPRPLSPPHWPTPAIDRRASSSFDTAWRPCPALWGRSGPAA